MTALPKQLSRKLNIDLLSHPGDYCFDTKGRVILSCPGCGAIFVCPHHVLCQEPLTLSPSVVGPEFTWADQVFNKSCGHHFWVKNGQAVTDIDALKGEDK